MLSEDIVGKQITMKEKKYYITKQETDGFWSYVGDPLNPNTTLDVGLIKVDMEEVRVDQFGAYVLRFIQETVNN